MDRGLRGPSDDRTMIGAPSGERWRCAGSPGVRAGWQKGPEMPARLQRIAATVTGSPGQANAGRSSRRELALLALLRYPRAVTLRRPDERRDPGQGLAF